MELTMLNEEQCWAAVVAHDASQDGRFFYSVRTTGVYCRPGCASRQPRRENVAFYESTEAAETAGFRPCKRCRPNEGSSAERHIAAVGRACALIRARDTVPTLAELAAAAGISRFHFHRVFKQITGATPREWGKAYRLDRFAERLDSGEPIAAAVYGAGFGASSRAYAAAPNGLGMTPGARRRGGAGERIRFTVVATSLKQKLVAADAALAGWAKRIVRFITRPGEQPDLPLDIRGTAFQARVWRALQKIPPGHT